MLQEAVANVKPRRVRAKGLAATKGFTGDEFAFVYRSGGASLLGKEKKKKTSDKKEADETADAVMDPSGFTEKQIRDKMRQLPGEWQKSENGYWEDVETDAEKRARAVEMLQEAVANMKPRRVRAKGLAATKGFTGDEFAFVYRSRGASLLGKEKKKKTSDKKEADETADAVMDPSGFTEKQIRDKMRQLPGEWQKSENGYWEDVETDAAKRARAIEMLQEALANVKPRRVRAKGLAATKGFTGDEFAFVYRSGGASLLGKEKKKKTSDKKEADETADAVMDPSGFTEKQIRDKMRQLPGEWQKSENGYWEDVETDAAKRARAIEMLQEALAN